MKYSAITNNILEAAYRGVLPDSILDEMKIKAANEQTAEAIRKADNQKLKISLASEIEAMNNSPVIKDKPDLKQMDERRRMLGNILDSLETLGYDCGGDTQLYSLQFDYDMLGEKIEHQMSRGER